MSDFQSDDIYVWSAWNTKFLWLPKIINGKFTWLRTVYWRRRILTHYPEHNYEYQYARNIFEMN